MYKEKSGQANTGTIQNCYQIFEVSQWPTFSQLRLVEQFLGRLALGREQERTGKLRSFFSP